MLSGKSPKKAWNEYKKHFRKMKTSFVIRCLRKKNDNKIKCFRLNNINLDKKLLLLYIITKRPKMRFYIKHF